MNDIFKVPCSPFPTSNTATNPKFLFLREVGGEACLVPFLKKVEADGTKSPHWGGTLVIDGETTVTETITIPSNFTLAGVGMYGPPVVLAKTLKGPAIRFAPGAHATLRDLRFEGENSKVKGEEILNFAEGILIEGPLQGPIYLDRITLSRLRYGIRGSSARSVYVTNCNFNANTVQIELLTGLFGRCSHWRIRDSNIRHCLGPRAIIIGQLSGAEDVVIEGCVIEGNPETATVAQLLPPPKEAIDTGGGFGVFLFGNRFESNGQWLFFTKDAPVNNWTAVRVSNVESMHGCAVRFACNYTSSDYIKPGFWWNPFSMSEGMNDALQKVPDPTQTHIGFNSTIDFGPANVQFPLDLFAAPEE